MEGGVGVAVENGLGGLAPGRKWACEKLLQVCNVNTVFYGRENWSGLEDDIWSGERVPMLAGLMHGDYIDPLPMYQLMSKEAEYTVAVLKEGFRVGEGWVRSAVLWWFLRSSAISREDPQRSLEVDLPRLEERLSSPGGVGAWYLTGNRKMTSKLRMHYPAFATRSGVVTYPFVALTDRPPIYASKSSLASNFSTFVSGFAGKREEMTYYSYLMPSLDSGVVGEMMEGENGLKGMAKAVRKFEVIRVLALGKLLGEQPGLETANPDVVEWLGAVPNHLSHLDEKKWSSSLQWLRERDLLDYLGLAR